MKILYDLSFIENWNKNKGIPVHALRIVANIPADRQKDFVLMVAPSMLDFFRNMFPNFKITTFSCHHLMWYVPFFRYYYRHEIDKQNCDVVIISDECRWGTAGKLKTKKISFVHDIKSVKPDAERKWLIGKTKAFFKEMVKTSDLVMAISRFTRDELLALVGENYADKVKVLYNSVSLAKVGNRPDKLPMGKYILYVNTLAEYKNIFTTLKAFAYTASTHTASLVVVGQPTEYWTTVCVPFIQQQNLSNRVIHMCGISDENLKYLYEHASLFVNSSLHEGFGFTPIEAAICGCQVLTTKCEALEETTKNMLEYYDPPMDYQAMGNKIRELVNNPIPTDKMQYISNVFRDEYSPQTQVRKLLQVIDMITQKE